MLRLLVTGLVLYFCFKSIMYFLSKTNKYTQIQERRVE